jgi:hypothetical protein
MLPTALLLTIDLCYWSRLAFAKGSGRDFEGSGHLKSWLQATVTFWQVCVYQGESDQGVPHNSSALVHVRATKSQVFLTKE